MVVYNCFPFYLNFTNGERCINPIEATSSVLKHDRQEIFGIQRKVQETLLPLSNNDGFLFTTCGRGVQGEVARAKESQEMQFHLNYTVLDCWWQE
jgi:hypothetical protein